MAKPMTPGKVSDNLDKSPRSSLTGLLYNFDVADDKVKPEHERWLVANVLPLLSCDQAVGRLKGLASRSGSAGYNLALSQRRVENVKKLLADRGAPPAKLNALWVGEQDAALAGRADGTEDEKDRAVGISVQLPARPATPAFDRENPQDFEDGFDQWASPPWLMVPTFGKRQLVFRHGAGVKLTTSQPMRLRFVDPVTLKPVNELLVTSNRQVIQFVGGLPGIVRILGQDLVTGKPLRLLDAEVMHQKRLKVAVHFVTDPQHPTPFRPVASVQSMIRFARKLFLRQANVILEAVSEVPDTVHFTTNISDPLSARLHKPNPLAEPIITPRMVGGVDFPDIARRGNPGARVNVFFVWEWDSTFEDFNGQADRIGGANVLMEDDTGTEFGTPGEGYTFAHEVAHCLGVEHRDRRDASNRLGLMWPFSNDHFGQLNKDEVRTLRKNLA
jgi:hypothetical protein